MQATLTFQSIKTAKDFTSKWACKTLTGHDMGAVKADGSVKVTVYDLDKDRIDFIEAYINNTK